MLAEMPAKLFMEWQYYFRQRPFGEVAADIRMGILCSLVANMFRKRGKRAAKPEDFMLGEKQRRQQTQQEMLRKMQQFTMAHNMFVAQQERKTQ